MTDQGTTSERFQKVLVARYSPQNQCFGEEGDILYAPALPDQKVQRAPSAYYFLTAKGDGKRSKFGWVKSTEQAFSVEEFVAEHPKIKGNDEQTRLLASLFTAIAGLAEGTPVAGSYFFRGIEHRRAELTFHKVFFHLETADGDGINS